MFDPRDYQLPNNCIEYTQSPQTLVFDDFVRVYFSTRERDEKTGKFFSHIAFAEFERDFSKLIRVSDKTVIPLGELGTFDEHGIFPINLLRDNGKVLAYTCGWSRRVSVPVETSTGLAISEDDGLTFTRLGKGPIMSSSVDEPFLVGDSFVLKFGDVYHMWYMYGQRWIDNPFEETARVYKVGQATSNDGISWTRDNRQIIEDKLNVDECQALPTVIESGGVYHMFFCYRQAIGFRQDKTKAYRIGYAYSHDLSNWTRDDDNVGIDVSVDGWDSDMMCYPHVFAVGDRIYLLYNGNEFGRYGFGLAVLEET